MKVPSLQRRIGPEDDDTDADNMVWSEIQDDLEEVGREVGDMMQAVDDLTLAIHDDCETARGCSERPTLEDVRNNAHDPLNRLRKILGMDELPMKGQL